MSESHDDELPLGVAVESTPVVDQLEQRAHDVLEETAAVATNAGADDVVTATTFGSIPAEIRSFVNAANVDLVVMGTHGRTGLGQQLLGSVTERVLRTAPIPVVTTKVADDD
ncbi:universal stress protein [Natronoglomus mannanivorans]|uniref:Universal stress protein n=1 Tax=Natronoglomus mannanivorans TaxID=2979990 RepID=A0AAP3E4T9_9EURY|nr:universal stress protein [Halobacteria archaeon AArc-xg1-1]